MKIGVIGSGHMGTALIKGLIKSGVTEAGEITAADPDVERLGPLEELGVETTTDNEEVARRADAVFLAVKPSLVGEVLGNLNLSRDKLLISIAAGVGIKEIENHTEARVVRVMPNLCAEVAEISAAFTIGSTADESDERTVRELLGGMGTAVEVEEDMMDAVTGLSGSGPAYVFAVIKAMKEAGEELGIPAEKARKLAAQTLKGGSEIVLNSDKSLEELIDEVCSPKGTTIEGMKILREQKFQKILKDAVFAATERSKELSG